MRLQPLYDLQQEINRLFVAGSKFAKGDPRLLKHVAVFNKLGEKVPVFKKLATDLEELTNTDIQHSAEKLSAISILLYSILYTQGETTEEEAEECSVEPKFDIQYIDTDKTYLQLKPVLEALTESKSGRLEVLQDAYRQDVFKDFRTFQYLDLALGDKYGELVNYVSETIIPNIGKPMLPFLLKSFVYDDRPESVRRLRAIGNLGYENIGEMCDKILSESLPNMQAEVIRLLSDNADNEALIIKLADDKNKTVREAAYQALAKIGSENCLEKLKTALTNSKRKSDLQAIVQAISSTKMPFFFKEVFNEVKLAFEDFISLDKTTDDKKITAALDKFNTELQLLENKDYPEVYTFLTEILTNKEYNALIKAKKSLLDYIVNNTTHTIISCFNTLDPQKVLDVYISLAKEMPDTDWTYSIWRAYFSACVDAGYTKEKIYDTFSEVYQKGIINPLHLYDTCAEKPESDYYSIYEVVIRPEKLDKRWIDWLYKIFEGKIKWNHTNDYALILLNAIEPRGSKRFENLLILLSKSLDPRDVAYVFRIMVKREIPDSFELIYSVVSQYKKSTAASYYFYPVVEGEYWSKFPKEYVPKFRELYDKQKLDIFNEIADKIENQ